MKGYITATLWVLGILTGLFGALYVFGGAFLNTITPSVKTASQQVENSHITIGNKMPYFDVASLQEGRIKSTDFLGTGVVLTFWATWNDASIDQIKIFDDYSIRTVNSEKKIPIEIFMINSQEQEGVAKSLFERGRYTLNGGLDLNGTVSNLYKVQTLPTTFFITKDGIVAEIFVGVLSEKMLVEKIEQIL